MKKQQNTLNPILRAWGNLCGVLADLLLTQTTKYGDYYEWEKLDYPLQDLENMDHTIAWKEDD
jgi:hypothetical protein